MKDLQAALATTSRMTVFRSLRREGYLASCSHRGSYYTLERIPDFNDLGLWSCQSVLFSRYGNLLDTVEALLRRSKAGYLAHELEELLKVEVKHTLVQLVRRQRIVRSQMEGRYVYFSAEAGQQQQQVSIRKQMAAQREIGTGLKTEQLSDEMKAGIILFFSLLNEKQRRLYAGLEAAKLGYGGDSKVADLLGLDPHTVAKGRRELWSGEIERGRVRQVGGGNKRVEKKRPK